MQITGIPANYASLRNELTYAFSDTAARTFDIRVIDATTDQMVGARRFTGVSRASLDIAPMLRRRIGFIVQTTPTGFVTPAGRTVSAEVELDGIYTQRRTFLPTSRTVTPPALLTTFKGVRYIGRGESDELTICTPDPAQVTVTAISNGVSTSKNYTASTAGVVLFRLNTNDFPKADSIQLTIAGIGQLSYPFRDRAGGVRLAWQSSEGSVEHYTFPVVGGRQEQVEKRHLRTDTKLIPTFIRSQSTLTLRSDYESERILTPLTEILSSPAVWRVEKEVYEPVEVVNTASEFHSRGTLRRMELQIRLQSKTILP